MDLIQRFQQYVKNENLFQQKDYLLIAVSGGVDSVVLCELVKQSGYVFSIAHCNFQLRGEESERDEQFVIELGKKYDVEVFVKKFDTKEESAASKTGIQETARNLRYAWFYELLGTPSPQTATLPSQTSNLQLPTSNLQPPTSNFQPPTSDLQPPTPNAQPATRNLLLTAHHLDDNIETLLMNFFKGTGIKGLRGILPKQDKLVRPLLFATKGELTAFAESNQLLFVDDSSNASDRYTRNYFRNQLIPDLKKVFPNVEENLASNLLRFGEIELLYRQAIDLHKTKLMKQKGNEIHIPVLKLKKLEPLSTIVYEIIRGFNFTTHQVNEVIGLLRSETGKYIPSPTHRVIRNRDWLIISPIENSIAENILIEEKDNSVTFPDGFLQINKLLITTNYKPATHTNSVSLDAATISFPLLLRKWKKGDYFYPLGMQKKKKLNRFFIDQKLSLTQKERTWVLESNKKIIWILGLRIDNRFKVTEKTNSILGLNLIVP